jgi:hypothetical protein
MDAPTQSRDRGERRPIKNLAEQELLRSPDSLGSGKKDRWRMHVKFESLSHTVRQSAFKEWNDSVSWIKLVPQQGAKKKEQLLVEITLGDNVPVAGLWGLGLSLSIQFLLAINLATSGFWWWPLAPNQKRFYEKINDLEKRHGIEVDDSGFHVFTPPRPDLTKEHMNSVVLCLTSLPDPLDQERAPAYHSYLGGLTFLSLNCIQWRCEAQAYGNFLKAMELLMVEAQYIKPNESVDGAIGRFLNEKYPDLDPPEHAAFVELVRNFEEQRVTATVKIGDVYLLKLLCETIFRDLIVPEVLRGKKHAVAELGKSPAKKAGDKND